MIQALAKGDLLDHPPVSNTQADPGLKSLSKVNPKLHSSVAVNVCATGTPRP